MKKWVKDVLQRLANALKRLAGKAAAALPGIIGSVIGAVLNIYQKQLVFFARTSWAVIKLTSYKLLDIIADYYNKELFMKK